MNRPNFFIVGAPKAGTTAMYEYLGRHPEIYVPPRKELSYFGRDLGRGPRLSLEEYLGHFADASPGLVIGTADVWCLYSKTAAGEIKSFSPDARIIVMLREPASAMYALHSESLYNGNEDIDDFSLAIAAEGARRSGRQIPRTAHLPSGLLYHDVFDYPDQVARYLDVFGSPAVHVVLFDDFVADVGNTYRDTATFLGVDGSFAPEFPVVNPNKRIRSARLRGFLAHPPAGLRRVIRWSVPPRVRRAAYSEAVALNTRHPSRVPLDPRLLATIQTEMEESVGRLEGLIGRDLSSWRVAK